MQYKDYSGPFGKPLSSFNGSLEDYYDQLKLVFCRFNEVKIAYLFGSYARGERRKTSDVDIAIVAPVIELEGYKGLWAAIREILSTERFDLVILDHQPVSFRFEVIKTARLIYVADDDFLNDFELFTIKTYLDTKPLRFINAKLLQERLNGL